jgi:hypothetical protein
MQLADRREKVVACPLALSTDFGADPTVLVVGVPLALLRAGPTGRHARRDGRAEDGRIRSGLPRHGASGGVAGIGAIEAEPNDANQLLYVALGKTGVSTGSAAGAAVQALLDATNQHLAIHVRWLWVQLDYLLKPHVFSSRLTAIPTHISASEDDRDELIGFSTGSLWEQASRAP